MKNNQPLKGREFTLTGPGLSVNYSASLLADLGAKTSAPAQDTAARDIEAARDWAESGLMPLTGRANGPAMQGPGCIASCARGALGAFNLLIGKPSLAGVNGATLLSERAAALGLRRQGDRSANGSCHLLKALDGWLAINLARDEDWSLLCAWLQAPEPLDNEKYWPQIIDIVSQSTCQDLVDRGRLMGLPVTEARQSNNTPKPWFTVYQAGQAYPTDNKPRTRPLVIDLSSLWAGPLCGQLLQQANARVIKVESSNRPGGARRGNAAFFDLMNAGKESLALELSNERGRSQLRQLLTHADIVIEGSRPRALKQMGIDAEALVATTPGLVWISITGYGREEPEANWVAFGDDAAAAAGICNAVDHPPLFCGDALADPLTGLHAAVAALAFWQSGTGGLVDLSLRDTAAHCLHFGPDITRGVVSGSRSTLSIKEHRFTIQPPAIRHSSAAAAELGAHTHGLFQEFQLPC